MISVKYFRCGQYIYMKRNYNVQPEKKNTSFSALEVAPTTEARASAVQGKKFN